MGKNKSHGTNEKCIKTHGTEGVYKIKRQKEELETTTT